MTTKDKIISGIKNLPYSVTIDDILDQIMLVEKIEKGIDQSDKNQVVPDDELDQRLDILTVHHSSKLLRIEIK